MNVLLSIKPKYVEKIKDGKKKYEFRKNTFKKMDEIEKIYVYSTSPEKKIIGYFTLEKIIEDEPENLWKTCKDYSGIERDDFFEYYEGKETGYALKIDSFNTFEKPVDPYENLKNFVAPQSFHYVEEDYIEVKNNC